MSTNQFTPAETSAEQRTQEMQAGLQRLARRDWFLWCTGFVVILSLTAGVASFAIWVTPERTDWSYQFQLSQSIRALFGLVLLFSVYTFYQQLQLKRTRSQLAEQIQAAGREQKRAEEFLKLAMVDPLTGLHNRRFAEERIASDIARAQRNQGSFTILMLDLNEFKSVNDLHGHAAGDAALKLFALRLLAATRGYDLPVRIGGDEFLVLLPECKMDDVERVLGRLKPLEIEVDEEIVSFSYSAGWAEYQADDTPAKLLRRADQALYAEKQNKKNPLYSVS